MRTVGLWLLGIGVLVLVLGGLAFLALYDHMAPFVDVAGLTSASAWVLILAGLVLWLVGRFREKRQARSVADAPPSGE